MGSAASSSLPRFCRAGLRERSVTKRLTRLPRGHKKIPDVDALVDRTLPFDDPERDQARISPDGSWVSYLAPVAGVMNVWVASADDLASARPITDDSGRGIQTHL